MVYNQIVTWTAFAILAMFFLQNKANVGIFRFSFFLSCFVFPFHLVNMLVEIMIILVCLCSDSWPCLGFSGLSWLLRSYHCLKVKFVVNDY